MKKSQRLLGGFWLYFGQIKAYGDTSWMIPDASEAFHVSRSNMARMKEAIAL